VKDGDSLFPGIFLRGMLMGAADIVPGVSGGTMAFITGIYSRLLGAISGFDIAALKLVLNGRWREAWTKVDGGFLLVLGLGIALSVFSLARLITHLLATEPLLLWSFFFGLILASALTLLRHVQRWTPGAVGGLVLAVLIATAIGMAPVLSLPPHELSFFFAGFIAICAMILPGISGSFILVLLGMYPRVLAAIESFSLLPLIFFALGAGSGLLVFSRLLHWLLGRYHGQTLAFLTGFLFGSLLVVWPWKLPAAMDGRTQVLSPQGYGELVGDPQWLPCMTLMLLGFVAVWLLETRWGGLER